MFSFFYSWIAYRYQEVFCIAFVLIYITYQYTSYQKHEAQHFMQLYLMQITLQEHRYFLDYLLYTKDMTHLKIHAYEDYWFELGKQVDQTHGFIAKVHRKKELGMSYCQTLTLSHTGQWCSTGQCNDACFNDLY